MARTFFAEAVTSAIEGLHLTYPEFSKDQLRHLKEAKETLERE